MLAAISLDNRIVYLFSCISVQSTNIPTSFISPMPLPLIMPIVSLPFTISQTYPPIDTLNSLYYSPSRCVLLFISLRLVSPAPCCLRRLSCSLQKIRCSVPHDKEDISFLRKILFITAVLPPKPHYLRITTTHFSVEEQLLWPKVLLYDSFLLIEGQIEDSL